MVLYPEQHLRGRYLSLWLAFRNGGSLLGGSINLAFNAKGTKTGKLDWRSYIVFVALRTHLISRLPLKLVLRHDN
jgi:MFS family permease